MSRAGLTPARVAEAASELVDQHGAEALTLAAVAERLGVKTPSLYSHVGGLEALRRSVALGAMEALGEACRTAAMGRAGADAVRAIATAYRSVAKSHPGTYALTQVARNDDPEWSRASERALEPMLAALSGMGVEKTHAIHAVRSLRSAMHGFVLLENQGGFGLDVSLEVSFTRLIDSVLVGIAETAKGRSRR